MAPWWIPDPTDWTFTGPMTNGDAIGNTVENTAEQTRSIGSWFWNNTSTLKSVANHPREFVLGIILDWAFDGTLDLVAAVVGSILAVWNVIASVPPLVVNSVMGVIGPAFGTVSTLLGSLGELAATLVSVAGPGGPFIWAIFAVAAYWFVTDALPAAGSSLPVIGPFVKLGSRAVGALNPLNYLGGGD